jgi:glucose-1-phosphatase
MAHISRHTSGKPKIEAIIFDIGRVIVGLDPARALPAFKGAGSGTGASGAGEKLSAEKIWAAIQVDPLWRGFQEGRVSPQEWYENLTRRFGVRVSYEEFVAAWNSVILPYTLLPNRLFERLSRRCKLVLLSNTDPIHVAHMEATFSFMRYFPARIYSCEVRASKPSPVIFRAAIRAAGAPAERVMFVDDVRGYVQAARRLGLDGVQFRTRGLLEGELRIRGVL